MNYSIKFWLLSLLSVGIILNACKKSEETDPELQIAVSPGASFIDAYPGEYKKFSISASSPTQLKKLKITYQQEGGVVQTLVDSTLQSTTFTYAYTFQIPDYGSQNVYLQMYFEVTDESGNTAISAKGINVKFTDYPLTEVVNNEMYGRLTGNSNAFNLFTASAITYAEPVTEPTHIADTLQADSLSYSWISPSGGLFTRNNTFNYDGATLADLKNTFESSSKTTKITNLKVGDIILFKFTEGVEVSYAAIKILSFVNDPGVGNDKYIFNIKK